MRRWAEEGVRKESEGLGATMGFGTICQLLIAASIAAAGLSQEDQAFG